MEKKELQEILRKHKLWLENEEGGEKADLRGTDLNFSCLPLWCGSLSAHFDDRQLKQIAYHFVKAGLHSKNASEETRLELSKLIDLASEFHRADDCWKVELGV